MDTNNQGWGFKRLDREPGLGRFTPNLLVCDDMLNDGSISKSGKGAIRKNTKNNGSVGFMADSKEGMKMKEYADSGSSSRYYDLDKWFDKVIDEIR